MIVPTAPNNFWNCVWSCFWGLSTFSEGIWSTRVLLSSLLPWIVRIPNEHQWTNKFHPHQNPRTVAWHYPIYPHLVRYIPIVCPWNIHFFCFKIPILYGKSIAFLNIKSSFSYSRFNHSSSRLNHHVSNFSQLVPRFSYSYTTFLIRARPRPTAHPRNSGCGGATALPKVAEPAITCLKPLFAVIWRFPKSLEYHKL